jgi:hypothetical protein
MQRWMVVLIVFCVGVIVFPRDGSAQIPRTLSYQGILSDTLGTPKPDGMYALTFRLYDAPSGGTLLWAETQSLQVKRGLFSAVLGSQTPFPSSLTFERQYWLGIQPAGNPELLPRIALSAVGYSLNSLSADSARIAGTVPNNSITANKIAAGQVVKSINNIRDAVTLRAQGGATITSSGDTITINAGSGGGGTGVQSIQNTNNTIDIISPTGPTVTANLKVPLSLTAAATPPNAVFSATSTSGGDAIAGRNTIGTGVAGVSTNGVGVYASSAQNDGIQAFSSAFNKSGVWGSNGAGGFGVSGSSSSGRGVYGTSNTGVGVAGYNVSGNNAGYLGGSVHGVEGITNSTTTNAAGVRGEAAAGSGETIGVEGVSIESPQGKGVVGRGRALGVYGSGADGMVGLATSVLLGTGVYGEAGGLGGAGLWGVAEAGYGVVGEGWYNGVDGETHSTITNASGVRGLATASSGQTIGVEGVSTRSPQGTGVAGRGAAVGGYFTASNGTAVQGFGIAGALFGGSTGDGVYGESAGGGNTAGVHGRGTGPNSTGVWGQGPGGQGPNVAGYFSGNLYVTGTKSFKIDHPLDPANKYLVHFCVESDEVLNTYSGNVVLDANGEAWVELPAYFEALNKDFRYQLTAIGAPGPNLYIAQKIWGNRFKIAGGTPGMEVSWQVTGIRNDPYLKAHPAQVEVEKTGKERGKYIHPKEYGVSETLGIEYEAHQKMGAELAKMKAEQERMQAEQEKMNLERQKPPMLEQQRQNK